MYRLIGKEEPQGILQIESVYNHDFYTEEELMGFMAEGQIYADVLQYQEGPDTTDPEMVYTAAWDLEKGEYVFTAASRPLSPEEQLRQQISQMQTILNTLLGLEETTNE